jgi:ElaB/YqjD/DUF883 family membrane-anchored ribosome-binding protein
MNSINSMTQEAADHLAGVADQAVVALRSAERKLYRSQARLADDCRAQVRSKPLQAIGIAAAVGLVLGWLIRRA